MLLDNIPCCYKTLGKPRASVGITLAKNWVSIGTQPIVLDRVETRAFLTWVEPFTAYKSIEILMDFFESLYSYGLKSFLHDGNVRILKLRVLQKL